MTERLYYTDSALTEFDAHVIQVARAPDGRPAAVLDRTAFYPTSGGQPFDTGHLGSTAVVDVMELEDGTILHVMDAGFELGPVRGRIDVERRVDHMQQHSGQHVLSAAFERSAGVATVGFHMGADGSTIDLAREVSAAEIDGAEEAANRIVWADLPVRIRFADASESAALPLRKASSREGRLRLVEIGDVDLSACGGTHVASTGTIGLIAVTRWGRIRGGTRLEFACGRRALRSHRALRDIVSAGVKAASVAPGDLPDAIERLQGECREQGREVKELRSQLASHEATALAAGAERIGKIRLVCAALEGWDAVGAKQIGTAIAERAGYAVILLTAPPPSAIVCIRSADVAVDSGALLKQMVSRFGGKGGGRSDLAQGGGLLGPTEEMLAHARTLVHGQAGG